MATVSSDKRPQHYVLALFPTFQLLDAAGPLDILRTITLTPQAKDITLTIVAETMSPVPTAPTPPAGASWSFQPTPELPKISDGQSMISTFSPSIAPNVTFAECLKSLAENKNGTIPDGHGNYRPIDVLIVPGGIGTRLNRISNNDKTAQPEPNNLATKTFITQIIPHIRQAIMTVCTGSDLLAQCDQDTVLNSRVATTNMNAFPTVSARSPDVAWCHGARWVRSYAAKDPRAEEQAKQHNLDVSKKSELGQDIEIWTSAGVSAGMDLTLAFVAEVYGPDFAKQTARRIEYDWKDLKMGEVDPFYNLDKK